MELLQLRYFLITAEYLHMTRAAETLHIAQPALSQSIRRLEEELHVKLFTRVGRNIQLSREGKILQAKLEPIISELDEIPALMAESTGRIEKIIKVNIQSASELVTDIIIMYKELNPDVNFLLSQRSDIDDWDIKISTVIDSQGLEAGHSIMSEEIFLAVPVGWDIAKHKNVKLADVAGQSFITLASNKPFSELTRRYCLESGFYPRIGFESDSPETVRDLIGAGIGVAFWPAYSWGRQESSSVKLMHIEEPECIRQIYVARKKEKSSSCLKDDFYTFMTEYLNSVDKDYFPDKAW